MIALNLSMQILNQAEQDFAVRAVTTEIVRAVNTKVVSMVKPAVGYARSVTQNA